MELSEWKRALGKQRLWKWQDGAAQLCLGRAGSLFFCLSASSSLSLCRNSQLEPVGSGILAFRVGMQRDKLISLEARSQGKQGRVFLSFPDL